MTTRFYPTTEEENRYVEWTRKVFFDHFYENPIYEIEDLDIDNPEKTKPDFIVKCSYGSEVVIELKCLLTEIAATQKMKLEEPFHQKLSKLEYPYFYNLTCPDDSNLSDEEINNQIRLIKEELEEIHPIEECELPKHFRLGGSPEQDWLEKRIKEFKAVGKDVSMFIRELDEEREFEGNGIIAFSLQFPSKSGRLEPFIISKYGSFDIRHDKTVNKRLNETKKQTIDFHGVRPIVLAINDTRTLGIFNTGDLEEFFHKDNEVFGKNKRKWLSAIVLFDVDNDSISNIEVIHNNNAEVELPESFLREPGCVHYRFNEEKIH
jgi:hypothetical protein